MIVQDDDSATIIFHQIKNLLFGQDHDEQQIINEIRCQPIKIVGNMMLHLADAYKQKLDEMIQSFEQQKNHLLLKNEQMRQKLNNYMQQNEFLKNEIDRLEQLKKQKQQQLNQSVYLFQCSKQDILHEIDERQKLKYDVQKIYNRAQQYCIQNSRLRILNIENERQMINIKQQMDRMRIENAQLLIQRQQLILKYGQSFKNNNKLQIDLQQLQNRLHQRQNFIANILDQYNKIHLFNQNDSAKQINNLQKIQNDNQFNQLQGFNFNNFDKNSNISQKSLSKNGSVYHIQCQMDQKFIHVNATAEKIRPKIPINYQNCATQQKINNKNGSKVSSKQKLNSKNASNKIQINKGSSNRNINKTLIKTVSSKNLNQKQSVMVSPSQNDGSKIIQQAFKKKLYEKNQKIIKLQSQVHHLKQGFIQQRQKVTIMQGQYELQIQQLRQQLHFTKGQLSQIYSNFTLVNAECAAFKQRVLELEQQMATMQEDHASYCEQLKWRCKQYVFKRIQQVELQYQNMKNEVNKVPDLKISNANDSNDKLQYSMQSQQEIGEQFHLKFRQDESPNEDNKQYNNIDSFSEIRSYERLNNHYLNGFEFELSSKMSNIQQNCEQIFVQQQFDIESDLGRFTQRLIVDDRQIKIMGKGNFTDRYFIVNDIVANCSIDLDKQNRLKLDSKIYYENIRVQKKYQLSINQLQCYQIMPTLRERLFSLISNQMVYNHNRYRRQFKPIQASNVNNYTFIPSHRNLDLFKLIDYSYTPTINSLEIQETVSQIYSPAPALLTYQSNLYSITRKQKKYPQLSHVKLNSQNINAKRLRFLQINSYEIDFNQQYQKQKKYDIARIDYIHIPKLLPSFEIMNTLNQCIQTQKAYCQAQCQTFTEARSFQTQTSIQNTELGCQTIGISIQSTGIQGQILELAQSQTQFYLQITSSYIQTNIEIRLQQYCQTDRLVNEIQCQTEDKIYKQIQMQTIQLNILINNFTQTNNQIIKDIQFFTPDQIINESINQDRIKQNNQQYRQLQIKQINLDFSDIIIANQSRPQLVSKSKMKKHTRLISQSSYNDQSQCSFDKESSHLESQISQESKIPQEHLSTKNDEPIPTISIIREQIQIKKQNYLNEEKEYQVRSASRKLSQNIQKLSIYPQILNNGMRMSEDNIKNEPKTFNPESKSNRLQRLNHTEISISPWFDDDKNQHQESKNNCNMIPNQIVSELSKQQLGNLSDYLLRHKIQLKYENRVYRQQFRKPRQIRKKVYIIITNKNRQRQIFFISNSRIHNLTNNKYIKFGSNNNINQTNFSFGQSQVTIGGDKDLIICRSNKKNKLIGDLQDSRFPIESYITCVYNKK